MPTPTPDFLQHGALSAIALRVNREQAISIPRTVMSTWKSIFILDSILLDGWPLGEYMVGRMHNFGHSESKISKMQSAAKIRSTVAVTGMYENFSYK